MCERCNQTLGLGMAIVDIYTMTTDKRRVKLCGSCQTLLAKWLQNDTNFSDITPQIEYWKERG